MNPKLIAAIIAITLAAGCETNPPVQAPRTSPAVPASRPAPLPQPPPAPPPEPVKPAPPVKSAGEIALDQGVALYEAGNYNGALKAFADGKEIWNGPDALKVRAYKYMAFSYCVTGRRTQCRQQFAEALKIDPNFVLEPAERSHPIWGPQFEAASKAATEAAKKPAVPAKPAAKPPAKGAAPAVKPPA